MATASRGSAQATRGDRTPPQRLTQSEGLRGNGPGEWQAASPRSDDSSWPETPRTKQRRRSLGCYSERDERRNVRTRATVNQLLDKYLDLIRVQSTTKENYESLARLHIRPVIGKVSLAKIMVISLDAFYNLLRKCRARCGGRKYIEHRTTQPHECDDKCKPHECNGLADGSLRKINAILSGAGKRAVRWGWVGVNPFAGQIRSQPLDRIRRPQPPTRPRKSPQQPGRTSIGACSSGSRW